MPPNLSPRVWQTGRMASGAIGTVTVSGLPQRDDHAMLIEELAGMLGVPLAEVALPQA